MVEARINLDWLDNTEYHRFLIWIVRNISGTDGWNNLQEGQVRFSRRDVELKLGVSSSKATHFTRKAVCDGLLNPLKMHSKRKGMGEVYDTLGDLKRTRFWLEPSLNQDRTKFEPSNPLNQDNLDGDLNQDRTKFEPSLNRLIDIKEEKKVNKESKRSTSPSAPHPSGKCVEVINIWNEATKGKLPQARITTKRARVISSRLGEDGWLNDFAAACAFVASTPFYCGQNDRGWMTSLDWVLQPGKATDLSEKAAAPKNNLPRSTFRTRNPEGDAAFLEELKASGLEGVF